MITIPHLSHVGLMFVCFSLPAVLSFLSVFAVCLCSVSMAPPPPPMPQLTPQIPLTGFVARVQENSKSDGHLSPTFLTRHVDVLEVCCMLPSSSFPSVCLCCSRHRSFCRSKRARVLPLFILYDSNNTLQ